ncbi:discoidin, CUB and LCCL domain-containing protein 2-like isoform X2 [Branchiostoma lanceolatum]|uniref:discoidin, CUB and LCCL domain-containing protein 2-like isoform X2 n=1 Tax=Branchiostoma lanceolatum TaxID=7740 RepID=UPI003455F843
MASETCSVQPSGMENATATITASTTHRDCSTGKALLNSQPAVRHDPAGGWAAAWCAADQYAPGQWLQVELNSTTSIAGVITQGRAGYPQWVTSYKLTFSSDGVEWDTYSEQGQEKVFEGNTDKNTEVEHLLVPPVTARFVRFNPLTWYIWASMRVEVLLCAPASATTDSATTTTQAITTTTPAVTITTPVATTTTPAVATTTPAVTTTTPAVTTSTRTIAVTTTTIAVTTTEPAVTTTAPTTSTVITTRISNDASTVTIATSNDADIMSTTTSAEAKIKTATTSYNTNTMTNATSRYDLPEDPTGPPPTTSRPGEGGSAAANTGGAPGGKVAGGVVGAMAIAGAGLAIGGYLLYKKKRLAVEPTP